MTDQPDFPGAIARADPQSEQPPEPRRGFSRRRLLGAAGIGAAGVAVGAGAVALGDDAPDDRRSRSAHRATSYPFYDEHQAGIITPVQDRLHFASFDVITDVARRTRRAAAGLDRGRSPDDPGRGRRSGRAHLRSVRRPARRHRRGDRPATVGTDHHVRLRPVAVPRRPGQGPLRARRAPTRRPATAPALPGRQPRPGQVRRRHLHPGLRRRSAGGRARGPQPRQDRVRPRLDQVVAARLRSHLVDVDRTGDTAQPVRLQGRHRQPQGRGA